jgi:hypothetical protein
MKIKIVFLIFFLSYYTGFSLAQETRLKYIGIEGGLISIVSEISKMDYIRGSMPSYYMGYSTNSLTSLSYKYSTGIKFEIFSLSDRFGLLGGIRFSHLNSSIGKRDYWTGNTNYFYWLYRQDGINTEYLTVKEVNQKSDYIGIPIEIRYFTARRPRLFRLYIKLGFEINYLLKSETGIVFNNPAMNSYEKDLTAMVEQPGKISSSIYGGGGFKIGRDQKPSVSFEACIPYLFLTSRSSGLLHPLFGSGFQLNFQIPIKSKAQ